MINAVLDGNETFAWGNSAICALVSIVMVFLILLIIIGVTHLIFKLLGYFELKSPNQKLDNNEKVSKTSTKVELNTNDEDMMAAVLVATIDYQNEIKKDVKLVNVREIK